MIATIIARLITPTDIDLDFSLDAETTRDRRQ